MTEISNETFDSLEKGSIAPTRKAVKHTSTEPIASLERTFLFLVLLIVLYSSGIYCAYATIILQYYSVYNGIDGFIRTYLYLIISSASVIFTVRTTFAQSSTCNISVISYLQCFLCMCSSDPDRSYKALYYAP